MSFRRPVAASLLLLAFLLLTQPGTDAQERSLPSVRAATIRTGTVVRSIEAAGALKPWRDVTMASQVAGTVTVVRCHTGQWVAKGNVLVELDDELARVTVQETTAAVERADAQLRQTTTDLERAEQLLETADISEAEFELLSLRRTEASAAVAAAQAQLKRAQRALRDTRIRAPFAGSVAQRFVEVGTWITPGQPVARVVDLSRMKADFGIPQQRTPELSVGMTAKLIVDLYPGVEFPAQVYRVGVVADPASGQFPVEVSVSQSSAHPLRPGMAVRLNLDTQTRGDAVLVPKEAVIDRGGNSHVLVVDRSQRVRLRRVELGSSSGGFRELVSGNLKPGDVVVTAGKENVADGDQVDFGGSPVR
jgi:membrane fusion protein (multidrug efflux system)